MNKGEARKKWKKSRGEKGKSNPTWSFGAIHRASRQSPPPPPLPSPATGAFGPAHSKYPESGYGWLYLRMRNWRRRTLRALRALRIYPWTRDSIWVKVQVAAARRGGQQERRTVRFTTCRRNTERPRIVNRCSRRLTYRPSRN